jgi:arsenate reductase (thioredoxin)
MITPYLKSIENELSLLSPDRHEDLLDQIAGFVAAQSKEGKRAQLNFICTHNSRRSQFSQAWCTIAQAYLGLDVADAYSGGTEVTACNDRTIAALRRAGCDADSNGSSENPVYTVRAGDEDINAEVKLWSKVFDDEANPKGTFAAIMTCDHADQNCPFIPGAAIRVPLTYTDPKYADDTENEMPAYDLTCKIIATDMIRLFKKVKELI